MNFDLDVITTNAIVIVPVIVAIVQAIKLTGWIKDHFAPLLSIAVGVLIGWLGDHANPDFSSMILGGVVYGLMASGLYSGVKTTFVAHSRQKAEKERQTPSHQNSNRGEKK